MLAHGHDRHRRESIEGLVRLAERYIWGVTALIAVVFTVATAKDIPLLAIIGARPENLQGAILSFYIWCWAIGCAVDTHTQKSVYLVDPMGGRVRPGSVIAVVGLAMIASFLLIVRNNEIYFAVALAVFTLIDLTGWLYLRHYFLPEIVVESRRRYVSEEDYFGLIQLKYVEAQICGGWKWYRQIALTFIVFCMVFLAVFPAAKEAILLGVEKVAPSVREQHRELQTLMQNLLLLTFVLTSEIWHWALRLRTYWTVRVVSEIEAVYIIVPKAEVQL